MSTLTLTAAPCRMPGGRRGPAPVVARSSTLRLTHRGRALALVVIVALAAVVLVGMGRAVGASTTPAGPPALTRVVVAPGQTLWAIALRVAPGDDPRDTVIRLEQLNELPSAAVRAGQTLLVPSAG